MDNATNYFLNSLKKQRKLTSDYQLAKLLNAAPSRIANYRSGRRELDDNSCLLVADLLGLPDHAVFLAVVTSREKNPRIRKVYEDCLEHISA